MLKGIGDRDVPVRALLRGLLLCLLLLLNRELAAKSFPMLRFGLEEGLPSTTIYDLYQDSDGFIWIGTDKGVARYNGREFEQFNTHDGLSDNECFYFVPDYNGRLWIGTFNGELCYYKNGKFHNPGNTPFLKLPSKASYTAEINVYPDSSLCLFFKDDPGFYILSGEKMQRILLPFMQEKHLNNGHRHILKTGKRSFDICYNSEKVSLDVTTKQFTTVPYGKLSIGDYIFSRNGSFFVSTEKSLYYSDFKPMLLKSAARTRTHFIHQVYLYDQHEFLATNKGIIVDDTVILLPDEDIHAILKDRNGDYWIGTAKNGLFKMSHDFLNEQQLRIAADEPVIFMEKVKSALFYATKDRNVYRIDLNSGRNELIFDAERMPHEERLLKSTHWIAGDCYYNISRQHNYRLSDIFADKVKVQPLKMGNLWGANSIFNCGNNYFFKTANSLLYYPRTAFDAGADTVSQRKVMLPDLRINFYGAATDAQNNLWFSTVDAVYRLTDTTPIAQRQFRGQGFKEFLFINKCFVGITHQNELLIARNYNTAALSFDTVKNQDCIWNKCYRIGKNGLLLSTNNFFRFLTLTLNEQDTGKPYKIRSLENPMITYQPEFVFVDSTHCFLVKHKALSIFPLSYLLEETAAPVLKFTAVHTADSSYSITDSLRLGYREAQNIRISFTPLSFLHATLDYEYSLSSVQEAELWHPVQGRELNLINPGYGLFTIKIRALTGSGTYTEPEVLWLVIGKPYWASWWFRLLSLLFSVCLLSLIVRLFTLRMARRNKAEIRFLKSEYKALNALMNPHFIFNALNSVQGLVNNKEHHAASRYIRIFADLIRQNMHNISLELISIEQEMTLVENYIKLEQLRLNGQLKYTIEIDPLLQHGQIMIPPLLIQPLVENAIRHGIWPNVSRQGILIIHISRQHDGLLIEIIDNGTGFNTSKEPGLKKSSYALTNINQRIEKLAKMHKMDLRLSVSEQYDEEGAVLGVKAMVSICNCC